MNTIVLQSSAWHLYLYKTVEVSEQIAATVIFADGFERGGTCLWSSSES